MSDMTVGEFWSLAVHRSLSMPEERVGQAVFNVLSIHRPDLANAVRGRYGVDPFYQDKNILNFAKYIQENW